MYDNNFIYFVLRKQSIVICKNELILKNNFKKSESAEYNKRKGKMTKESARVEVGGSPDREHAKIGIYPTR